MELIFKLPVNKPPFIGILYPFNDYKAQADNQDIVANFKEAAIFATLCLGSTHELRLSSYERGFNTRTYQVTVNLDKLKAFTKKIGQDQELNFGHVVENGTKHELAYTLRWNKPFVIKLASFRVQESDAVSFD